jgi:hypothetical protein
MKRVLTLSLIVMLGCASAFSQADTLNKTDENGKKTGWWITYTDDNLEVLKDSVGATHYFYNYYQKDIYLYRYGEGYGSKKHPVQFPPSDTIKLGNYTCLDGMYVTKYKNGNIRSSILASKGILIEFKKYYSSGELKLEIIYSSKCGAPKQHCLREYKKDGSIKFDGFTWLPKNGKSD